jgi:hypothetical protein
MHTLAKECKPVERFLWLGNAFAVLMDKPLQTAVNKTTVLFHMIRTQRISIAIFQNKALIILMTFLLVLQQFYKKYFDIHLHSFIAASPSPSPSPKKTDVSRYSK